MSIIDQKRKIYGEIAAFRTSCEGFPNLKLTNSFESINNCSDSLDFLLDLLKTTIGFDSLKSLMTNILTFELGRIENDIKKSLKRELNKIVSCGVNPSIPDSFKHQNINPSSIGINLDLRKIDYMGLMLINPSSNGGFLLYNDNYNGLNSTDFHTYLYETIQLDGIQTDWGSQSTNIPNNVLSFEFNSVGPPNNILNIKASEYYSNPINNKKLTDLNNDFIDSINLFETDIMFNKLVDSIFGTVSFEVKRTKEQIKKEIEVEEILSCLLNLEDDELIDDSFFTFNNDSLNKIEEDANYRSNGVKILKNCDNVITSVPPFLLTAQTVNIKTATTKTDSFNAISNGLDKVISSASEDVNDKNRITAKLSFINDMIKKLMIKMGSMILSPKIISIFAINHKIIYGVDLENPIDWMKKNSLLFRNIMYSVRDSIIKILLENAIKEIKTIVACNASKVANEYAKSQSAQIASLVGVPQDVLRLIQGLG